MNTNTLLFLFSLMSIYNLMLIKTTSDKFISDSEVSEFNDALKCDDFFSKLREIEKLGYGSYGLVLKMTDGKSNYAVKITNQDGIQEFPKEFEEYHLKVNEDDVSIMHQNMRFLKYLNSKGVPFILKPITDRTVVMVKKDDYNSIVYKNAWVLEYGNLYDMDKLAKWASYQSEDLKYKLTYILLYRLAYAFEKMVQLKIIHGDVKPENIFMKTCRPVAGYRDAYDYLDATKDIYNICPIIGDFDLAYHTGSNHHSQLRYTSLYRPLEMFFMTYGRYLYNMPGMYTYSLKEDVFALGASMIKFVGKINLEHLNTSRGGELRNLLRGMIKPITYTDVEDVVIRRFDKYDQLAEAQKINSNYKKSIEKANAIYYEILKNLTYDDKVTCNNKIENFQKNAVQSRLVFYFAMRTCLKRIDPEEKKIVDILLNLKKTNPGQINISYDNLKNINEEIEKMDVLKPFTIERDDFNKVVKNTIEILKSFRDHKIGYNDADIEKNLIINTIEETSYEAIKDDLISNFDRNNILVGKSIFKNKFSDNLHLCAYEQDLRTSSKPLYFIETQESIIADNHHMKVCDKLQIIPKSISVEQPEKNLYHGLGFDILQNEFTFKNKNLIYCTNDNSVGVGKSLYRNVANQLKEKVNDNLTTLDDPRLNVKSLGSPKPKLDIQENLVSKDIEAEGQTNLVTNNNSSYSAYKPPLPTLLKQNDAVKNSSVEPKIKSLEPQETTATYKETLKYQSANKGPSVGLQLKRGSSDKVPSYNSIMSFLHQKPLNKRIDQPGSYLINQNNQLRSRPIIQEMEPLKAFDILDTSKVIPGKGNVLI